MSEFIDILLSLVTLTILEVVLGIDNLVFLAIIAQRLPGQLQARARKLGLTLAWVTRILLLAFAVWLTKLTEPLLHVLDLTLSGRDLFLLLGGLFLLVKATQEIHNEFEPHTKEPSAKASRKTVRFSWIVTQIALLDIIFSLDSVLTAVGLTQRFWLMVVAISVAIIAMVAASEPLSEFIKRYPTIKMLALAFLILIGVVLIADGLQFHIPRGYIYSAMAFSLLVESLNILKRKKRT